jgi:hypothetical protein
MSIGFRDLVVWQKSMQLAVSVYELTKQFPREEDLWPYHPNATLGSVDS